MLVLDITAQNVSFPQTNKQQKNVTDIKEPLVIFVTVWLSGEKVHKNVLRCELEVKCQWKGRTVHLPLFFYIRQKLVPFEYLKIVFLVVKLDRFCMCVQLDRPLFLFSYAIPHQVVCSHCSKDDDSCMNGNIKGHDEKYEKFICK